MLGEDIYPLIGVIARWDADRLATRFIDYPVRAVLKKEKDFNLKDEDKVYLFSNTDIYSIFSQQKNKTDSIEKDKKEKKFKA